MSAFLAVGVTLGVTLTQVTAQPKEPPPPARVAVVDVASLFRNYKKASDYAGTQRVEAQRLQAEDETRRAAIVKESNALSELKPGSPDAVKQEEKVEWMGMEYRNWQTMQQARQERQILQRTREMYDDIVQTTAAAARRAGYNFVMTKEPADMPMRSAEEYVRTKILYADNTVDITADVLIQLNERYAATKK